MKPVQKQTVDRAAADIVATAVASHGKTTAGRQLVPDQIGEGGFRNPPPFQCSCLLLGQPATAETVSTQSKSNEKSKEEVCQYMRFGTKPAKSPSRPGED